MFSTTHGILVGLTNGATMFSTHTYPLTFPYIPLATCQSHIFPALANTALIYIGQLYEYLFTATFNNTSISLSDGFTTICDHRYPKNNLY